MNPLRLASLHGAGARLLFAGAALVLCVPGSLHAQADDPDSVPDDQAVSESRPSEALATDFLPEDVSPPKSDAKLSRANERKADALAAFVRGFIAEAGADVDKELTEYRRVLNIDPGATITTGEGEQLLLSVKVAYELARRGDVSEGIGVLKDSIKAVPDDPVAYIYLAQLYLRFLRKPDLALKYAAKALDLAPAEVDVYSTIYEIHIANEQPKKAEHLLDRAAKVDTDDPNFWAGIGNLYRQLLVNEDGSAAPEAIQKIDAVFEKAVSLAQNDSDVLMKAADYYVLSNQVAKAIPLYSAIVSQDPRASDASALALREKLARSYLANGEREKAVEQLNEITKLNPLRYETYELLGELYQQQQDWDKALAAYQQSLLLAPGQPLNYLRIAAIQQETQRFDKAVEILIEARKRFPDYPRITYTLAFALSQANRNQEAVVSYEEALHEAELLQDDMLNGEFYFHYGIASEQAGLREKAVELMRKSIALDPANAGRAYNYIGYMWVDRGEHLEEGARLIRKALELEPDNPAYLDSLGWYFYKTGQYDKALVQLLRAAQLIEPEDAVVFDHVGDTYAKLNNIAQALIYWQKAAALNAADKSIAKKIEDAKEKLTLLPAPLPP